MLIRLKKDNPERAERHPIKLPDGHDRMIGFDWVEVPDNVNLSLNYYEIKVGEPIKKKAEPVKKAEPKKEEPKKSGFKDKLRGKWK
jgi:hypothetical protein